jgi:hypothetical protein
MFHRKNIAQHRESPCKNDLAQITEVLMQQLFLLLLVLTVSGMAANKLDEQFCRTAIAGLALVNKIERFCQKKDKDSQRSDSSKPPKNG